MEIHYTTSKNVQVLLSLLKQYKIRKIIASPGTTNISIIGSMQYDPFFQIYSAPDERSAAYMACGLAAESGEPVMLTCTGATASRNYIPGLTEAFYRKLPVLAVTASQFEGRIGNHARQALDRSSIQKDIASFSVRVSSVKDNEDMWNAIVKINRALHHLYKHGGGPVHIEMETCEFSNFTQIQLPTIRKISYYTYEDKLPSIPNGCKLAIIIGSHLNWNIDEIKLIDIFCEQYNAAVLCDHTSNYYGNYLVNSPLIGYQQEISSQLVPDLVINIGEITADYPGFDIMSKAKKVWRVSKDGEIRDLHKNTESVFEMSVSFFFKYCPVLK